MKLTKLPLETVKFATINGNRNVETKRLLRVIKKDGRVLVPILVVKYKDIQNDDVVLNDLSTGERLESPSLDCYVILDGQHRSMCALQLYDEMQKEGSDVKFTDFIYANVLEDEDIQEQDIMVLIMSINSSAKSWASKDYINSAYIHNPKEETLIVVDQFTKLGFSISNTSRHLYNNHKVLTPSVLSRYISGESELPESNPRKSLEIMRMLLRTGFSIEFLKKRYLAEEIVMKRNGDHLEDFLNSLCRLDSKTVNKIEELTPQELDNHEIRNIIKDFEKTQNDKERAKHFEADLSEKRFKENIELLKNLAEELRAKKHKKPQATKGKSKGNIVGCTVDDVK